MNAVERPARTLKCSFCVASWAAPEGCIYCGERGEAFSIRSVDEARPDRMIETCQSCGGYLKSLVTNEAIEFPLLAVEDLATADLDAAAAARGFRRPPLKRF
ncbi:MAG: formate dehydrogenase accessory protein FdhE [Acidobacteria bacterium]|nr:formate dehydrogenase accessory protein FdhE [Acidobacteriota bacterium]